MKTPLSQTFRAWLHLVMRRSMRDFVLYARQNNYSVAQLNALFRIHHKGGCGVSDLGEEMGVTSAAASQLLEKLVQQGLAQREEDPQDRRNKRVAITPAGEKLVRQSIEARQGWLNALINTLSPAEQQQVNAALHLLIEKMQSLESGES